MKGEARPAASSAEYSLLHKEALLRLDAELEAVLLQYRKSQAGVCTAQSARLPSPGKLLGFGPSPSVSATYNSQSTRRLGCWRFL